jgi:hypothetical protein
LESFQNFNVGGGSSAPELYTIGPDGLKGEEEIINNKQKRKAEKEIKKLN